MKKWCLALVIFAVSCAPSQDERCGDPDRYYWQDHSCWAVVEDAGDSEVVLDAAVPDSGGALPSGLGSVCTKPDPPNECDDKEATHCAIQPGSPEGYCTVPDCLTNPDTCPGDYSCCDFTICGVPNFCANAEHFAALGEMCQ